MHACMLRTTFSHPGLFPEGSTMIVQAILVLSKYRFNIKVKTALLRDFQFHRKITSSRLCAVIVFVHKPNIVVCTSRLSELPNYKAITQKKCTHRYSMLPYY